MATKEIRSGLARIALTQEGVREEGGNNNGPKIREYQAATWLEPASWPWCAAFVDWAVDRWVKTLPSNHPLFGSMLPAAWRPMTAGAFDLLEWAKKRKLMILPREAATEAGDIVVFDMSHCGIVVADHERTTPLIRTVEGNTGPAGKRDSTTGDGVFQKKRHRSIIRGFIRLELA